MEEKEFERIFGEKSAYIDKMLHEVVENYITIKALSSHFDGMDLKLQVDANKLLADGFRTKVLQIIVALEEQRNFVKTECIDTEKRLGLLKLIDFFILKSQEACDLGSDFLKELENLVKGDK